MFAPLVTVFADVTPSPSSSLSSSSSSPSPPSSPSPSSPEATRVSIGLDGTAASVSNTYQPATNTSSGTPGEGYGYVTWYPSKPLLDDESPRSLQPFLQRTSALTFDLDVQVLQLAYSPSAGGGKYTQVVAASSTSLRLFVLPELAVLGAVGDVIFGSQYTQIDGPVVTPVGPYPGVPVVETETREVAHYWGSVGVDARSGDAGLSLQWRAEGVDATAPAGTSPPTFFPARFSLAGRVVLARRYDLSANAELIPDGARGGAGIGWYPTQDLGLSVGGQVERGQIYWNTTTDYTGVLGGPTVSYWLWSRVELWASYEPEWVKWDRGTEVEQRVTVGITARIPRPHH